MKVQLKTGKELQKMHREGRIHLGGGDTGEYTYIVWPYNGTSKMKALVPETVDGTGTNHKGFDSMDLGEEFLIVDHPNVISKDEYEWSKLLFNPPKGE